MKDESSQQIDKVGPFLFLRGQRQETLRLSALVIIRGSTAPLLRCDTGDVWPDQIAQMSGYRMLRYDFALPCAVNAWYELDDIRYEVATDISGDARIGFVSCNGQEHGDLNRPGDERNEMWHRLCDRHRERPFNLLIHGGDQLYADEVTESHHLSSAWPSGHAEKLTPEEEEELSQALREAFFQRYLEQWSQPGLAWLTARVPSLAMWDDHDICDGWGSLKAWKLDSAVGRILFAAAREFFLLFQCGAGADEIPETCIDPTGDGLSWGVNLPGLTVIAPDLRSQRRPDRVMGQSGWEAFRFALESAPEGRVLVLSTVPALGPRLSILERIMKATPWMDKYEDDLRDQWQSYAHRGEWQDFLRAVIETHERPGHKVSLISGEIHLATRGTMRTDAGDLHQLVASGISHPAPPTAWAGFLSLLARLGEAPLRQHPIKLHRLPGHRAIYTAERNYLILERNGEEWTAIWDLEDSGPTEPLPI
ncbi:alkaline phosphatase D family protein [Amaricoccus macauensis]|uniref:alkaline phosphatase D family protein n=1 Tax=Amaricoccus macauensis TaxID=57001 RepID=UPI003C7A8832